MFTDEDQVLRIEKSCFPSIPFLGKERWSRRIPELHRMLLLLPWRLSGFAAGRRIAPLCVCILPGLRLRNKGISSDQVSLRSNDPKWYSSTRIYVIAAHSGRLLRTWNLQIFWHQWKKSILGKCRNVSETFLRNQLANQSGQLSLWEYPFATT